MGELDYRLPHRFDERTKRMYVQTPNGKWHWINRPCRPKVDPVFWVMVGLCISLVGTNLRTCVSYGRALRKQDELTRYIQHVKAHHENH